MTKNTYDPMFAGGLGLGHAKTITRQGHSFSLSSKWEFAVNIEIKVLGSGCANCKRLYSEAQKAIAQFAAPARLTKVEEVSEIMKYKILALPGLVIDDELKSAGRVPTATEITTWLATAAMKQESKEAHAGISGDDRR